jgi:hypothetical protein
LLVAAVVVVVEAVAVEQAVIEHQPERQVVVLVQKPL